MNKRIVYRRQWLNRKEGRAFLIVSASLNEEGATHASLELADCTRSIELDFYCTSQEQAVERLAKIDRIRAALDAIEDRVVESVVRLPTNKELREIRRARQAEEKPVSIAELDMDDYL